MAQKRMFNNLVIESDDFLEMPDSSQNLYFHLSMYADDDGFIDKWKSIMRMTGKKEDDLKILIAKAFVIPFESGLIVIRHWKLNNYIQKDRYKETIHKEEKALLTIDNNGVYNLYTKCIPSIDKNRLDKSSIDKSSNSIEKANDSCDDGLQKVIDFFNNNVGSLTPYGLTLLEDYLKELPSEVIIYAMQISVEADKRNIKYIKAILNTWISKGIKTLVEAQKENQSFKNTKNPEKKETLEEQTERFRREWGLSDED